jgi:hypothetical protein
MATYYKYAERSADSQINWAEVGKNMSDMLKEETRIREEKKAAINAASREYGQVLANSPQGEHEPARQAALKFADNASKYMLMQDKLLKSGQMSLKDYTISRQNLLDGTDNAFTALKDYQSVFAKKMERSRTSKSSLYELRKMEQAEGFGNFSQTEFYINPTNGSVNVAKKTKKVINGQEVYTMDEKPGEFASINYVKGLINGEWDKFDSNAVTDAFAKGLGEEMKSIQTQVASFSKTGEIKSISDITSRTDIDPATKQVLFKFVDAENQMIDAALANPFNRASVLTDNNVSAANGKLYDITTDPAKAKANPNLILEVIDPATGMGTIQFTPDQTKISQEFMRNQFRAKYDYKEETKVVPQLERNEPRAPTATEVDINEKRRAAKNVAQNLVYSLTGNANESAAGTKYLSSSTGLPFTKTKEGFIVEDENGNVQTFKFKADGKTLADPTKFTKSFIGTISRKMGINEDDVIQEFGKLLPKGAKLNELTEAAGFEAAQPTAAKVAVTPDLFTVRSEKSSQRLQNILPAGFSVKDLGVGSFTNNVEVKAPNGKVYKYNANLSTEEIPAEKAALEKFIRENGVAAPSKPAATTNTTVQGGKVRG